MEAEKTQMGERIKLYESDMVTKQVSKAGE